MKRYLVGGLIINEQASQTATIVINNQRIERIYYGAETLDDVDEQPNTSDQVIECHGRWILPGCIDDQVHFRDPGLTHKATIESESRAAIAGGVTSFMDMPNTKPPTTNIEQLMAKRHRAKQTAWANYAFFFGGTNKNYREACDIDPALIPGLKLFLGASTGNMLVDDEIALNYLFEHAPHLIAIHSENEDIIQRNKKRLIAQHGANLGIEYHNQIRSEEACYTCTQRAVQRAQKYDTRLHILHLSTEKELEFFNSQTSIEEKKITAEVCVHHLWFSEDDYATLGNRIKWNPAIKKSSDRDALRRALRNNQIDIVATDHAPHLPNEKEGSCTVAASGGPLVQYSLLAMLELAQQGHWTREHVVQKMAHDPARLFRIKERGFIRPGYYADLVIVDPQGHTTVEPEQIISLCGWSPFEGHTFNHTITTTIVNGDIAYHQGEFNQRPTVLPLEFKH